MTQTARQLDEFTAALRREQAVMGLLPLFFVSGATALAYQTIWARQLHLIFGTSTFAISTVLAAFMGGMALGGWLMSRWADRVRRPLAVYGALEVGIGAYALIFPSLVAMLTPVYLGFWRALQPSPLVYGVAQFALVSLVILVPTAAMGATLPVLARFATERLGAAGDRVGTLYGVNTAGAVLGTWLCGFLLLPSLGLWSTTLLAAFANLSLGASAVGLSSWARGSELARVEDDLADKSFSPALLAVGGVMALAGFASLVYEVAWNRLLGLMLGGSVYAFSLMLLAFLVGIATGGKLGGVLADRVLRQAGLRGVLWTLALVEVGVAVLSYALMHLYSELPFWYVWLFDWVGAESEPGWMWLISFGLSVVIMTPPAVLMGVAFPVAVRAVIGRSDALGGPVGRIYAANTLGSMLGAAIAGFVLLPLLQVQGAVFFAGTVNLLAAAVAVLQATLAREGQPLAHKRRWAALAGLGALVVLLGFTAGRPAWDPLLMTAGMYKYASSFSDHSREGIISYAAGKYDLLYYEEGLSSVVTVARNRDSKNIWLANNGKVEASTTVDMPTQVLVSMLPFLYVPDPKDVLVIGLASGITAGAVTTIPAVEHLQVVELEPATVRAARFFDDYNWHILDDPRTDLVLNDGRNHVLLAEPGSYDVIISEPSNPWISGVSNLFTRDFLEVGKSRLKPGGVWAQWIQLYGMDERDMRTLLATFAEVYPHVVVFATVEDADLVLLGSERPLPPAPELAEHLMRRWPKAWEVFEQVGVYDPLQFTTLFQMDRDGIVKMAGKVPLNTDDNMRIEYRAPLNLHRSTQLRNYRVILENAEVPYAAIGREPVELAALARRYWKDEDEIRAIKAMASAAHLQEDPDLKELYYLEAETWQQLLIDSFGEGPFLPSD